MTKRKIAVALERDLVERLDALVEEREYRSRSQAVEEAVAEKLARRDGDRLLRETAKLDPDAEKALAEEGMGEELGGWPDY